MDLGDHRDSVVGQALDEVHLPQWAAAVKRSAGELPDHLVQLATTTWSGQPPRPNVVGEVDIAMLAPHRVVELKRDVDQLIAKRLKLVQPTPDNPAEGLDIEVLTVLV